MKRYALPLPACEADAGWRALVDAAGAPYRRAGHFAWHFARGKLARNPVFRSLLERGDLAAASRVVDIGCGQGLLASLLQACSNAQRWPSAWGAVPQATEYLGIELMPRDVKRARSALHSIALAPRFACGDMRQAALPACDRVVILDVLHYVPHHAQAALLTRVRDALAPHGRLLLRVGDAGDRRAFATSQWIDRVVTYTREHRVAPTWCRTRTKWVALLRGLGFAVEALPMSRGTPFANVLRVAER